MRSRSPSLREADIKRSVKAVRAAGLQPKRIECFADRVLIHFDEGAGEPESPLEAWRRKHGEG